MRFCLLVAAVLALAVSSDAKKYASREDYAKTNEFELSSVLVAAGVPAACKAISLMNDTDLLGGDITPTILVDWSVGEQGPDSDPGTKFPDTVVDASSPDSCCTMCHIHPDCAAFTWTDAANCDEWLGDSTTGCCFLKYGSGFSIDSGEGGKGKVSGILPASDVAAAAAAKATCAVVPDSDTSEADLTFDEILPDLVVPAASAQGCCNACARVEGCGGFTLAPTATCESRLGKNAPGCCFLKPANGWKTQSSNTTGFFTSGRLLESSTASKASSGSAARRLTRRLMNLLN